MKRLLHLFAAALLCSTLTACMADTDIPSVTFSEDSYLISADGGELIIPVRSTGVHDLTVKFSDRANWTTDENGDMIPTEGWLKIVKVIEHYQTTRDLAEWTSGIVISVEPNKQRFERSAYITAHSFGESGIVRITQSGSILN